MMKTVDRQLSNDKVIQYLHGFQMFENTPSDNQFINIDQHRLRLCSENESISSSISESSLSDPIAQSSYVSSKESSDEDLDFNIGFEQINDDDEQYYSNKTNTDAITLLNEPISDLTIDDTINDAYFKHLQRANFLHDSTYTLCSSNSFSNYEQINEDIDNCEQSTNFPLRSNSFTELPFEEQRKFVGTTPKKVVRFADMMGLDLESIRYMTPPDQTTAPIIHECLRLQFGQLHLSKTHLNIPKFCKRSLTSLSLSQQTLTKQYNLVSKHFTSRNDIIPLIYAKQVLLECLYTKDSIAYGTIRVHNCAYEKHVFVRLTNDEWQTRTDIKATHSMNYSHDNTDTFVFQITLPNLFDETNKPKRLLFAICLQTPNQDYWDNNQGWNYVLDVLEKR